MPGQTRYSAIAAGRVSETAGFFNPAYLMMTGEQAQTEHAIGRIRSRPDFVALSRHGRTVARPGLVLQAGPTRAGDPDAIRLGLTVTRKVGNAVTRNRVRRRLREAARLVLPGCAMPGTDYVLIGRKASVSRRFEDLQDDLRSALRSLAGKR